MQQIGAEPHGRGEETRDEHLLRLLYRRGCQGDNKAAEIYMGYRWGRPMQANLNLNAEAAKAEMTVEEADRVIASSFAQPLLPVIDAEDAKAQPPAPDFLERARAEEHRQGAAKKQFEQLSRAPSESPEPQEKSVDQQFVDRLCGEGSSKPSGAAPRGKFSFMNLGTPPPDFRGPC